VNTTPAPIDHLLAETCAADVIDTFDGYNSAFRAVTRRALQRFDTRDWNGSQRDAVERIELYERYVDRCVAELRLQLGTTATDRGLWQSLKAHFAHLIVTRADGEFRKTFFNSVTRRFFGTVGVDAQIEFVALDLDPLAGASGEVMTTAYANRGDLALLFEDVLGDFRTRSPWRDFNASVKHVAGEVQSLLEAERVELHQLEVIRPVFWQTTRAYLVGRIECGAFVAPLVIALRNSEKGVHVDAVLLREADVSILFSFTRSYFHVDLERVGEAVLFLKRLLPRKPISELFTVLGRARQGKTERFRELFHHLEQTDDLFDLAPGERGLVMVCFTLPSFDVVFKLIRDQFPVQKNILREDVLRKYDFVFKHDRAGRLVDAQEFKRLRFPRARFSAALLHELLSETSATVHEDGSDLIIDHCYIERRMVPLNLYLQTAAPEDAAAAVVEYGQCIRDLAYTNIFAGDLLLKNFGVTRHHRVIFYDYDELCLLTECHFRDLPTPSTHEDEMSADAWFYVADNDVFPETFLKFLSFSAHTREVFLQHHGELLTAQWWRQLQLRHGGGEVLEVLPYGPHRVRVASSR
jgi:isocitrate dehydrogenase kinase/phosphatase